MNTYPLHNMATWMTAAKKNIFINFGNEPLKTSLSIPGASKFLTLLVLWCLKVFIGEV